MHAAHHTKHPVHRTITITVLVAVLPLAAGLIPPRAHAIPLRPVIKAARESIDEILEVAARVSKREGDDAARKALRPTVEHLVGAYGDDAVRAAARRGGLELLEACARHGDEVLDLARRCPAAARVLAVRADELVPLTRRFGIEVLKEEAAHPGLARIIVRDIPSAYSRQVIKFAARRPDDALRLAGMARDLPTLEARTHLVRTFMQTRNKTRFIEILARQITPGRILTAAAAIAIIDAAHRTADGLANSMENLTGKITPPQAEKIIYRFIDNMTAVLATITGLPLLLFLLNILIKRRANQSAVGRTTMRILWFAAAGTAAAALAWIALRYSLTWALIAPAAALAAVVLGRARRAVRRKRNPASPGTAPHAPASSPPPAP